jgi:peptidoglycan/LPS O-acetylase OafA/YrhL
VGPGSSALILGYGLVALGCCALLVAFLGIEKKALPSWAIYLGRISYGLYVFHWLAIYLVGIPMHHHFADFKDALIFKGVLPLALTILIASLSYRYFETPFLKLKKSHEVIESRPV